MLRVRLARVVDVRYLKEQPSAAVAAATKWQHVCLDDAQQGTIPASLGILQCEEGSLLAFCDAQLLTSRKMIFSVELMSSVEPGILKTRVSSSMHVPLEILEVATKPRHCQGWVW